MALLLSALLLSTLAGPATAQEDRSLAIEAFDVTVDVGPEGAVEVVERIRFRFEGSWNGVFRLIPVEYRTPQGFSYDLLLKVDEVTDGEGEVLRTEQSRDRHYRKLKVWVPGATDATRTVVFRYRSPNALRFFEDHDELYWNVTGDEWDVPIQAASARIRLPAGATGLRAAAFTGGYGSRDEAASIEELENGFYFETLEPLSFGEGLTVAVGWDPGVVARPSPTDRTVRFARANWLLVLPLVSFGLMFWLWRKRGRDPARGPVMPEYEPPGDLGPAEAGTLVDGTAHMRDVTAILVDLAVRGFVRIEEEEREGLLGILGGEEYSFHRVRDRSEWQSLRPHEREYLDALFEGRGDVVRLSDLENEFYKSLPEIRDRIYDRLVELGYYRVRPDRVRRRYVIFAVALAALGVPLSQVAAALFALAPGTTLVAVLGAALPVGIFGFFMPARTVRGARKLKEVLGFEEFLQRVEEDRFMRMIDSPEKFEAYLPYAMALAVEKKWARAFEDIYTEPPEWYVGGPDGFRTTSFVGRLDRLASTAGSAMASSPRSSGGSGFSGGGSSGGGFGGGGGGGF